MIEIRELIIRGKVNGSFDQSDQEIIKMIESKIENALSNYDFTLSKGERKSLVNQCIDEIFEKIDFESKS